MGFSPSGVSSGVPAAKQLPLKKQLKLPEVIPLYIDLTKRKMVSVHFKSKRVVDKKNELTPFFSPPQTVPDTFFFPNGILNVPFFLSVPSFFLFIFFFQTRECR
jgi:hypothetical protein